MNEQTVATVQTIKKLHIKNTVEFAINNIPGVDEDTLEKFLELVNARGNFGEINEGEIMEKMNLIMKYIPHACVHSLLTVAELLDIRFSRPVPVQTARPMIIPSEEPRLLGIALH